MPDAVSVSVPKYELASVLTVIVYVTALADGATSMARTTSVVESATRFFDFKELPPSFPRAI